MRVVLVAHTSLLDVSALNSDWADFLAQENATDADQLAATSGRLCYESFARPNPATATNHGYLGNIISMGHFSVLEHATSTFYIDGVSRNFTHELIRHRHLSFSEVSQRYVDVENYDFVYHPTLASMDQGVQYEVDDLMADSRSLYRSFVDYILTRDDKPSRKEARQAARFVMPSGLETKIIVTGNHRAWRDMLSKRLSPTADLEFQAVAKQLLIELKKIAPNTYQDMEIPE